jgi:hypothetical protein
MPKIYKKVLNLLEYHLSINDLLEFHECMDGDAYDEFLTELAELCAKHRPEEFVQDDSDLISQEINE